MGSPQEAPKGKDAALPERFKFNPAEVSLAVRAVGDYAISSLRISEANWPIESFHAFVDPVGHLEDRINTTRRFLDNCSGLMRKLSEGEGSPSGVELTGNQLELTMDALFHFGVHTSHEARMAAEGRSGPLTYIGFNSEQDKQSSVDQITDAGAQTRTLFKKLEPVAIEHSLNRMIWDDRTVRHQ